MSESDVIYRGDIATDVRRIVSSVVKHLGAVSPIVKQLEIHVVPASTVEARGKVGFGLFGAPDQDDWPAYIVVGGRFNRDLTDQISRKDWLHALPEIVAHEWAHAEQWRDGKKLTERGINRRMRELLEGYVFSLPS